MVNVILILIFILGLENNVLFLGFKSKVLEKLEQSYHNENECYFDSEHQVHIFIDYGEWSKTISNDRTKRKRFNVFFDNILTSRLQNNGIKCSLKCTASHFKKENSRKKSLPDWSAIFKCKKKLS